MNLSAMHNINTQLFLVIHQLAGRSSTADAFLIFITTTLTSVVLVGVGIYIAIYLPICTTDPIKRMKRFARSGEVVLGLFFTWLVTLCIKVLVAYPRPFETIASITPLVTAASRQSFPSAHAALTMALATFVYLHYRRLGSLLFVFAFMVGMSRIYVGVHYPLDVGVGFLIGFGIVKLLHQIFDPSIRTNKSKPVN